MTRRRRLAAFLAAAALLVAGGAATLAALDRLYPPPLDAAAETSPLVLDRDGRLLRAYAVGDGRWRLAADADAVDPDFLAMLVAYEDRRFFRHAGVDPLALLRAAAQAVRHGRIVSGGSTLTMQLARLIEPRAGRSLAAKTRQIVRAVQIERRLGKREILARYLTLAPYGGNIEGVRAAALAWFGREPRRLTVAEAALLVALPQSPEARRPDRNPDAARAARDRVLARLVRAGALSPADAARAAGVAVPRLRRDFPAHAAHAADAALREGPGPDGALRLTIARDLQAGLETLARERAEAAGARLSVAILVADHGSGEVLARVGSADFFDAARDGRVDMTRAVRSPGSTLKPLIYALAFETGLVHPNSLIDDRPLAVGGYRPRNFDLGYQGTVTVREALQMSLNVPAVLLLETVGPAHLAARLRRAGVALHLPHDAAPGLAVALGGVGTTLHDLVTLYAAIARGGNAIALAERPGRVAAAPSGAVLGAAASWYVADILAGTPPPAHAAGGRIAYKTGTSYGYRDSWAVGFDGRHVVGVWVGRPDGSPVSDLTGRGSAAPILFDAFARLPGRRAALAAPPREAHMRATADLPAPLRRFVPAGRPAAAEAAPAPVIAYPPAGARVDLALGTAAAMPLTVKVEGGTPPFRWIANGAPVAAPAGRRALSWMPDGRGVSTVTVIDATGRSDRVSVFAE